MFGYHPTKRYSAHESEKSRIIIQILDIQITTVLSREISASTTSLQNCQRTPENIFLSTVGFLRTWVCWELSDQQLQVQYPSLGEFITFVGSLLGPTVSSPCFVDVLLTHPIKGKLDPWWMNLLMVHSDYQRQGVSTSLVNIV